jgi:uncharacterized protein
LIIDVKVTPKASANMVKEDDGLLRVYVTAVPEDGKANKAVIKLLAKRFGVNQSAVRIIRGAAGGNKTVEIDGVG